MQANCCYNASVTTRTAETSLPCFSKKRFILAYPGFIHFKLIIKVVFDLFHDALSLLLFQNEQLSLEIIIFLISCPVLLRMSMKLHSHCLGKGPISTGYHIFWLWEVDVIACFEWLDFALWWLIKLGNFLRWLLDLLH